MKVYWQRVVPVGILCCLASVACSKQEPAAQRETPTLASAASAPAAPVPAPAASTTDFAGSWTGTLNTERYDLRMTRAEGAVAEWASDEGKIGVGQTSLQLDVNSDGVVSGSGDGVLGKLVATGQASGEKLAARVSSSVNEAAKAFSGTLLLARAGDTLKGKLQVSTGDSLVVRQAEVMLTKLGTAAAPAAAKP